MDIVERFEGIAVGESGVAEDANDMLVALLLVAGSGHAQSGRESGSGVTGTIAIMLTLGAQGESVETVRGADGMESVLATREDLMDIALMTHIPDELVFGGGEDVMERDAELNDAQIRSEMATVLGQLGDKFLPHFHG